MNGSVFGVAAYAALSIGMAAPALAQIGGDPISAEAAQPSASGPDIVVTGSLIRGSPEDAPAPIQVISSEQLAKQGAPTVIELLKNLPISNGIIGDANQFDSRSSGQEGAASVNLRGLGGQRTLVLLNGRRMVAAGVGIPFVDVNMFPAAAIGRIEVLKDGAAATYGSDAIAGVVNFITRDDLNGFIVSGDYRYISKSDGDYGASLTFGHTGPGFRMLASVGYQHRSELRLTDRDFAVRSYGDNPQGGWTGAGNPGNWDFNGATNGASYIADRGCQALGGFETLPGSTADRCFNNFAQFDSLVEPEDRLQVYVDTQFDVTDDVSLTVSALYGRDDLKFHTSSSYLASLPPTTNAAFGNGATFVIPGYAPSLRDYCATYGASSGCTIGADGLPAAAFGAPLLFRPVLLAGNPIYINEHNDRGSSVSYRQTDALRFTGELNARLTNAIDLRVGAGWSEYLRDLGGGDMFTDLFQNALAGFGGADCPYASTTSRAGLSPVQLAALAGTSGCTFYNPFSTGAAGSPVTGLVNANYAGTRQPPGFDLRPGAGLINDAATFRNFYKDFWSRYRTRQIVADAIVSGKSGIILPGGDLAFALGAQYRKESFARFYSNNNNIASFPCPGTPLNPAATCPNAIGALGYLGTNPNQGGSTSVYALFAELQVPVLDAINVQLSARYEDYGGATGSTFDPQARVKVQLSSWLALRGGLGTTFRGPLAQNLSGSGVGTQPIGSGFRAIEVTGNPDLTPESATTYNAGVLVDTGGFSASVDYFRFEFTGSIEAEPVGGMVTALFGVSGSANCDNPAYAALQARFTFPSGVCGINNVSRLRTQYFNAADVTTSGVDVQARYGRDVWAANVTVGGIATYIIDYKVGDVSVEGVEVQPAFNAVGLLNTQTTAYPLPHWRGNAYLQGDAGPHSLRLQYNYIDSYIDQRGAGVFGPNVGALAGASVTGGKKIASFQTVDVTYRLALDSGSTFTLAAVNIFDKDPPFARLEPNYDSFTASPLGFTLKAAVSQKF